MKLYLAPMEGITGSIVRNAFLHNVGCIDKYFTPFIPAAKRLSNKIIRDIAPENNKGINLVPQLISNSSEEVLEMMKILKDRGFNEFNINLGCPSGTVTGKKRGSGMLKYPEELDRFLDGIYSVSDCPVSVKTRIGFDQVSEWPRILEIYSRYPISELIIHPRIRKEMYSGFVHTDAFALCYDRSSDQGLFKPEAICYNGDIWDMDCYDNCIKKFPDISRIMIGRGLLSMPDLACLIKGVQLTDTRAALYSFCDEIYSGYLSVFSDSRDAVGHMKEIWIHLKRSFKDSDRLIKKLLKNQEPSTYSCLVSQIFETLELSDR